MVLGIWKGLGLRIGLGLGLGLPSGLRFISQMAYLINRYPVNDAEYKSQLRKKFAVTSGLNGLMQIIFSFKLHFRVIILMK